MRVVGLKEVLIAVCLILGFAAGTPVANAQAWPNGYSTRRTITINHAKVPNTDQTNFAVLISGTYADLATTANGGTVTNASGYDIILTSDAAGANVLAFEQDTYSPTTGQINYWVKIPTLSSSVDTVIFMFYGNSSVTTDQSNKAGVWSNGFVGVWHLPNDTTLSTNDSTSNGNNATNVNSVSAGTGEIGGGGSFNGSNNYLNVGNPANLSSFSAVTTSVWINTTNLNSSAESIFIDKSTWPNTGFQLADHGNWSPDIFFLILPGGSGGTCTSNGFVCFPRSLVNDGNWHQITGVYNPTAATVSIYLDGVLKSSRASGTLTSNTSTNVTLGSFGGGAGSSSADEFRISNAVRSADWIATEYNNQSSPSTFVTVGAGAGGTSTNPTITNLSAAYSPSLVTVTITGANFGATQGSNTVNFNGISVSPTGWASGTIVANVPSSITSGSVSLIVTVSGITSNAFSFSLAPIPLPSPWVGQDIGTVAATGSGGYSVGEITLHASGAAYWNTSDGGYYEGLPLNGDGTIVARLVSLQGGSASEEAGVMIRESLSANSKFAYMAWIASQTYFAYRSTTGGSATGAFPGNGVTPPYWVKLVRSGNTFSGYSSADGVSWTQIGTTQTISMASSVYIGLATSAESSSSSDTAIFDNVSVSSSTLTPPVISGISPASGGAGTTVVISGSGFGASQGNSVVILSGAVIPVSAWSDTSITITIPSSASTGALAVAVAPTMNASLPVRFLFLPAPWLDADINTTQPGSETFTNGVFTIKGQAGPIGGTSDGMHLVYQSLSGDGSITARVASTQGSAVPQSGVMIRETLNPNSSSAFVAYDWGCGLCFETRLTTGATASKQSLISSWSGLPYWLRLARVGNVFTPYISTDGSNWTQSGTPQTISMAANVYVGMPTTTGNGGSVATAVLDNVSVSSVAAPSPVITGLSSTTGPVGAVVVISGSGFGTAQGNSLIVLNGIPVSINSWSSTVIGITIPSGASSGPMSAAIAPSMNESNYVVFTVESNPLPSPWLDLDINAGLPGSGSYANGVFTVKGATAPVGGTADGMHLVYQLLSGDGSITARIISSTGGFGPETGLMIRETLSSNSASAFLAVDFGCGVCFETRSTTGGTTTKQSLLTSWGGLPYWFRLTRVGNVFTPFLSTDGTNWIQETSQTISMAANVYVGMLATSCNGGVIATGTLDNVSLTSSIPGPAITAVSTTTGSVGASVMISGSAFGSSQGGSLVLLNGSPVTINSWSNTSIGITIPSGATSGPLMVVVAPSMNDSNYVVFTVEANPLPSPWLDLDINAGLAGTGSYASGVFTIKGATAAIGGTADGMHLVYQSLSGDGSITARLTSSTGGFGQQSGVMIRETLTPGAASAAVALDSGCGLCFETRSTTGGTTSKTSLVSSWGGLPYWLRVTRVGNVFTPYISLDALNWIQGTPQTISMASTVFIGMPATSGNGGVLATITLDSVSLSIGTVIPNPILSSISPAVAPTGTSVTIAGSHFGTSQGTSVLRFNGTSATAITSWSDNQIIATVPASASKGPVTVAVNATIPSNTSVLFTVLQINALTPPAAPIRGTIDINGVGFATGSGVPQILINGVAYTPSTWSDTDIPVIVPAGTASGPITVTQAGATTNSVSFTVSAALSISSISPTSGPVGSPVTITGTGFGATQSNSTVDFYGLSASVTSWTDTQIVVTVPRWTTSGPIDVGVAGGMYASSSFSPTLTAVVTDSLGNSSTYISQDIGGQFQMISATGSGCSTCTVRGVVTAGYDSKGNSLTSTDELGHTTTRTYDSNNNVLTTSQPVNSTTATTSYTYNSFGEVLTATDPLGHVTTNTYDANGNLLTVTSPAPASGVAASVTHFAYNSLGELTQITDPLGHVSTMTYTTAGLISTITDAQSNVTTYAYDAHGNRTSVTDALGNVTTFAYDAGDRLITITYPPAQSGGSSTTSTFTYDSRGRRTSATDQNGKITSYAYDTADRLTTVTDAASNVTTYTYDTENNLLGITDANSHTTNFTYDAFGRVTQTTFPSSFYESYAYDAIGNLTSKTDRKGQTIQYVYDALNRLTQKSYPDSTSAAYTFDLVGKVQQVNDPTGTYAFSYDNMGRLIGTTTNYSFLSGTTFTNAYTYDANSNRTGYTAPDGSTNSYTYDTLNRLTTLANSWAGSFNFTYDTLGRRTQMTRPNGVNTNYTYDSLSRLLSVLHQNGASTIDGASYTVDATGNRTSKTDQLAGVTSNYAYDALYDLTQVTQAANTTESYTYDPAGNRLSSLTAATSVYSGSNQLTSNSNATYTYDASGNTTSKTDSTGTTNYSWDFENRLASVLLPATGGTVVFKYDPFGRRIQKFFTQGTNTIVANYSYDGSSIAETTDGVGNVTVRYAQGRGIDEPLAMQQGSASAYYHADGLGSITSLTNAAGASAVTYTFDAFGNLTASTGSVGNQFRYTAREFDSETGLYYYRARYYNPAVGRFLTEDEVGNDEGVNLYLYVGNSPLDLRDPTGLYKLKGFPPDKASQMDNAIRDAIAKLKADCPSCAGPDASKIINALQSATYVYKPDDMDDCGVTNAPIPLLHHIDVTPMAFDSGRCCVLASTLTHEAVHYGAHKFDNDQPGSPYDVEKKCFNCGTGHPPPRPPKGPKTR